MAPLERGLRTYIWGRAADNKGLHNAGLHIYDPQAPVKMRQAILRSKTPDPKSRAAGYSHTYFDMAGSDQMNLSTFPSNEEISRIAQIAAAEVDSLISLLGLVPVQVRSFQSKVTVLPGINAWFLLSPTSTTRMMSPFSLCMMRIFFPRWIKSKHSWITKKI